MCKKYIYIYLYLFAYKCMFIHIHACHNFRLYCAFIGNYALFCFCINCVLILESFFILYYSFFSWMLCGSRVEINQFSFSFFFFAGLIRRIHVSSGIIVDHALCIISYICMYIYHKLRIIAYEKVKECIKHLFSSAFFFH